MLDGSHKGFRIPACDLDLDQTIGSFRGQRANTGESRDQVDATLALQLVDKAGANLPLRWSARFFFRDERVDLGASRTGNLLRD